LKIIPWYESIFVPNVRRKWRYHHSSKVHPRNERNKFFKFNGKVVDIDDFDPETLEVFFREVLKWLMTVNQAGNQCLV
jgi:hypothetical protein